MSLVDGPVISPRVTLIGANDRVDQNEYSAEVEMDLSPGGGRPTSGEIISVSLYSTESGSGSVQVPAGIVKFFRSTTGLAAGDSALSAADVVKEIGQVEIAATDWEGDASGKHAFKQTAIPYGNLSSVFVAFQSLDAASINDAAGDDELVEIEIRHTLDA